MPTLSDIPAWFAAALAVALGLLFGSFLNVVIHRLPAGESVVRPGSRCPSCGKPIRAWDNVPVLSWVVLRGRARCCKARIGARYPLVELIGGLLTWAVAQTIVQQMPGDTPWWTAAIVFAAYAALGLGLIAATFIDLEHMLLPDEITLGGTVLGLVTIPVRPDATWVSSIIGAAAGFLVVWLLFDVGYRAIRGQSGMGLGDAKLLMLAGAWFGWPGAVFALLAGAVQGTVVAVVIFLVQGRIDEPRRVAEERAELREEIERAGGEERAELERELALDPLGEAPAGGLAKARIPFGPFLALATIEYMLFGDVIVAACRSWLLTP